ncbi:ribosome silencing factor [Oscillibacter sp.]|uniref:ribosome silencing factor n=1 Tax=Oscillibacter sp. TaxID=1945593 RepID=UPI0028A94576|nr:ribosome silencing factor [Oscillibacter sp.]
MTPKEIAISAVSALDEKKGGEIAAIEIADLTALADYFVIATGTSNTQINALCDAVEKRLKEQGEMPLRREGYRDGTWVLLDYACVAVHVFSQEAREFYDLERLWRDGKRLDLTEVLTRD